MVDKNQQVIDKTLEQEYKYGFTTDIDQTKFDPGLNEEVITKLSKIKNEPKWLLEWRLKAFKNWKKMSEPTWAKIEYEPIDYQALSYYAAPKQKKNDSLDDVDPEILETYNKLGISLDEQKRLEGVAVDAVFDSVSIATTFKDELAKHGIIFFSLLAAFLVILIFWFLRSSFIITLILLYLPLSSFLGSMVDRTLTLHLLLK